MEGKFSQAIAISSDTDLKSKMDDAQAKRMSFADFIHEFLGDFIGQETKRAYQKDLEFFFTFLMKSGVEIQHPNHIEHFHFSRYRDWLIEKNYSPATINRKLVALRSFFKWALALKIIDHNPLDAVKLPKVTTISPTNAFTDEEVIMMLNAPDRSTKTGQCHYIAMILLFHLGLRRSELVNIKLKDIFEERNHIVLRIIGKGQKERLLPLNENVYKKIQEYIETLKSTYRLDLNNDDYLIQSAKKGKNDRPANGSTIYRIINRYAKQCSINKNVGAHSCRTTVISHLLDTQYVPIRDVADFAGHSNITTTERYDKKRKGLDNNASYKVKYELPE